MKEKMSNRRKKIKCSLKILCCRQLLLLCYLILDNNQGYQPAVLYPTPENCRSWGILSEYLFCELCWVGLDSWKDLGCCAGSCVLDMVGVYNLDRGPPCSCGHQGWSLLELHVRPLHNRPLSSLSSWIIEGSAFMLAWWLSLVIEMRNWITSMMIDGVFLQHENADQWRPGWPWCHCFGWPGAPLSWSCWGLRPRYVFPYGNE